MVLSNWGVFDKGRYVANGNKAIEAYKSKFIDIGNTIHRI